VHIGGREVVAGLVAGGEEGLEVGVGAVRDHAPGPSAAAAAGEDDRFRLVGRGGVEVLESRLRATLGRYGGRGARAPGVVECRRSLREAGVGIAGQRGLLERDSGAAGKGEKGVS
jgi:hypothetical protein